MTTNLEFSYNGIRECSDTVLGKLQKCNYYISAAPDQAVYIVARTFENFSEGVQKAFDVRTQRPAPNALVGQDRIYITSDHPLYKDVLEAATQARDHYDAKAIAIVSRAIIKAARIRNKFEGYTE